MKRVIGFIFLGITVAIILLDIYMISARTTGGVTFGNVIGIILLGIIAYKFYKMVKVGKVN